MSDDLPLRTPSYRVARPRGMDPATKRLALIAAGLGGALLVLIGAWSVSGPGRTGVPVIAPPAGPLREAPPSPGGMHVAGADQPIFGHEDSDSPTAGGSVMPPPEQPNLQALRAPAPPAAAPVGPPAATRPITSAPGAAPPITAPPGAALPLPPVFATAPPRPPATNTPALVATPTGRITVQLAALPTAAAAAAEWQTLRHRYKALLAGHTLLVAQARVGGHLWYRVRTAGFASQAAARGFCSRIRAAGAACDVPRG